MASQTVRAISPAEYLAMRFPDREPEYVHGELRYKPMPDRIHGKLQAMLTVILVNALSRFGFSVETEVRCKLEEDNFRLPDIAVFPPDQPEDLLPDRPAFIAVEIVSRDEKYTELLEKLEDYRTWGVPHIWIVDPWRRQFSVFDNTGLRDVDAFRLPEHGFETQTDNLMEGLTAPGIRRRK